MAINRLATFKLLEAKKRVKLIVFDYDGTIYDGYRFGHREAAELVFQVLRKGIAAAVITARAATAFKTFLPEIIRFQLPHSVALFLAGGNGAVLYQIFSNGDIKEIYNHSLSFLEIKKSIALIRKSYCRWQLGSAKLNKKGLKNFRSFLKQDWSDLISPRIMKLNARQKGVIFAEAVKVSFVLPRRQKERESLLTDIQNSAGQNYQVVSGDKIYGHLTKCLNEDGKLTAVKTIARLIKIKDDQVVAFGDMPLANDKGLLSFIYSFTNTDDLVQSPPYFLGRHKKSPLSAVYEAVNYLIK